MEKKSTKKVVKPAIIEKDTCSCGCGESNECGANGTTKLLVVVIALLAIIVVIQLVQTVKINDTYKLLGGGEQEDVVESTYDVSKFKAVTADEFIAAYKGKDISVVYFGRSTCSYCVAFVPILNQAQADYGYKTLYVDITAIDSAGAAKIKALEDFFNQNYGRTPITILVKDGKIVDSQIGASDYNTFASVLEKNGFKK